MAAFPAALTAAKSYVVAQCTTFLRPAPTSNSAPDGWPAVTRRLSVVRWQATHAFAIAGGLLLRSRRPVLTAFAYEPFT